MLLNLLLQTFSLCHNQELEERLEEEVDNNANVGAAKRKVEASLEHAEEQLENLKQQMQMVNNNNIFL